MQGAKDYTLFVIICALLLFLLTFIVLRGRVAVTDTGDNVTQPPLTRREVENMISQSAPGLVFADCIELLQFCLQKI